MFTIYHSNQLDILKHLLVELIRRDPLPDPLADEQILVQSPGMAQWLRQQLAEGLSIAASIEFPLPASFLWDMFVRVLPYVPKRSAFNKEAMTWKIITLLPEMIDQEAFAALRQYLAEDHDGVRLYQLAEKIADTFDQYLVYRPEWIAEWEQDQDSAGIAIDQPWQPELWRALVKKTADQGQSHWHRANMHNRFLDELHNGQHQHKLPQRLFVFGISALPPHFVETLNALGQQTDVHLLVCNPCRYYWGDEKDPKYLARMASRKFASNQLASTLSKASSKTQDGFCQQGLSLDDPEATGNPLLGSMGKLGRDYLHQLHALDTPDISAFVDGSDHTLLQSIQTDILELVNREGDKVVASNDHSLEVHSCHSALREVEVLHDQLLAMFEQNPELTPKDVVVMLPDVDQYSPWIQAVFGGNSTGSDSHKADPRRIPFSISDRSASNEHPILTGLLRLLDLDNSRCSAPEILELLEIPALQRRFELSADDFNTLRRWVNDTGIRWGISPEHQQQFDLPPRNSNSWLFGLRRMLLGYAMPEASGLYDDILPFESVQGMNARLAGQLADFIENTDQLVQTINQQRTVVEWTQTINTLMDSFFLTDEDDEYALKLVHESLEHLHEQLNDAGYEEPLSRPVLLAYLTERLTSQRSSQRFLAGQVNFCTLMPMRSIPFKVVCLLGLNDGAYPRSIPPTGFDLIAQHSRRGDRSRREDDRYLFLEALLSAREKLYISYVGHSIKDNTERVPSVLITELLNYCEQGFTGEKGRIKEQLLTEHPLQPFSPSNFTPDGKLFSYAHEWLAAAKRDQKTDHVFLPQPLRPQEEQPDTIELSELLRFYRNSCKYFFNRRLKVFFEDSDDQLADTEPFTIEGLEAYSLKQGVLETLLISDDLNELRNNLKATGQLPHGAFGELLLEEQQNQLSDMVENVRDAIAAPAEDIEVNLSINGLTLSGWLKHMYNTGPVRYRPAKVKGRDIMLTWIEHLCYCASAPSPELTLLFGLDATVCFNPVSPSDAEKHLGNLVEHYQLGHNKPLPFFPETAYTLLKNDDDEKAVKAAIERFNGGFYPGENSDAYIGRCYPTLEPVLDDMSKLTEDLMQPLMQYMEITK